MIRNLNLGHKSTRVETSLDHLMWYERHRNIFLFRIILSDETSIHHFNPITINPLMTHKHLSSPVKKTFRVFKPFSEKIMVLRRESCDSSWFPPSRAYQWPWGRNCGTLWRDPHQTYIHHSRPSFLREGIVLLDSKLYTARLTQLQIRHFGCERLDNPDHSDLASVEFYLFPALKIGGRGNHSKISGCHFQKQC